MKVNAPEKIYLQKPTKVRTEKKYDNDIEYIRTDAFMEKACKYLFENYHGEKLSLRMIDEFRNYMKGD
jgi:hypothetical protein